jgi:GntR family transcriptional regulator
VTDSKSAAPTLAYVVRDELRAYILDHHLRPGDLLPSENEIIKGRSVGRTTVREAFRLLEQEGLVRSRQGLGRIVIRKPHLSRPLTRLEGVTEMMASRGLTPSNSVLSVALDEPTPQEREGLGLTAGASVIRLERARRDEERLVVYSIDVFDRAIVPFAVSEVDWTQSLFVLFEQSNRRPQSAAATISAVTLSEELAERLDASTTDAWIRLQQVHADENGLPVLLSDDYHRGSDFSFEVSRQR